MISYEIQEIYDIIIKINQTLKKEKNNINNPPNILYIPEIENAIRRSLQNNKLNPTTLKKELENFYLRMLQKKRNRLVFSILMLLRQKIGQEYIKYILQGGSGKQFRVQNKYII